MTGEYEALDGVRLVKDRGNDGDSFRVIHDGKQYHSALLRRFPRRSISANTTRTGWVTRARYFGLDPEETVRVGEAAQGVYS